MAGHYEMPITGVTIISLKNLKAKMGAEQELFTDESMLGFDKSKWERDLFEKYPIHQHPGVFKELGRWVKLKHSKQNRQIVVQISKKLTSFQLDKLISFCESNCPLFEFVVCEIKRKKRFEAILNLRDWMDLREFIYNTLLSSRQIYLLLKW